MTPGPGFTALLDSHSIAIIGASDRAGSPGAKVLGYITAHGYAGAIHPINPRLDRVAGLTCGDHISEYADLGIDHALLLVPGPAVLETIQDCGEAGVGAVSVYAGGFSAGGRDGLADQDQLTDMARRYGMRLLGPNCLGLINAHTGLVASSANSWAGIELRPGPISVISQSGALGSYLVGLLADAGLGLRYFVSTGNEADVAVGELLSHLAHDPESRVVVVYVEGVRDAEQFVAGLEAARRTNTQVIVIKVGGTAIGADAVRAHTAALAGDDAVYGAVLAATGAHRARTLAGAVDAARIAVSLPSEAVIPRSAMVITSSGGLGIMAAEALERQGFELPVMPARVQQAILEMLPYASPTNPIDGTADMARLPEVYEQVVELCLGSGVVDGAVISLSSLGRAASLLDPIKDRLRDVAVRHGTAVVMQGVMPDTARAGFWKAGIATHDDPDGAAALLGLRRDLLVARAQAAGFVPEPVRSSADATEVNLPEDEAMELLSASGLAFAPWEVIDPAASIPPDQLVGLRFPLAVKLIRPGVLHKVDRGFVELDVRDADGLELARQRLLAAAQDEATVTADDRLLLQQMVLDRPHELLVGLTVDPTFGRIIVLALGGRLAELYRQRAVVLPPISPAKVRTALADLDVHGILDGYRGAAGADVADVADSVMAFVAATSREDIIEAEVNPLMVGAPGVGAVAVDAVVRVMR